MTASLQKLMVALTYPPLLSLCVAMLAALLWWRYRRSAMALFAAALGWSLLWSIPLVSDRFRSQLEERFPVVDAARLPKADAIVVLGGGSRYDWMHRADVSADDLENSRLAAGARAWLAGRAPVVILSGGGDRSRSEASKMAGAITRLGVPSSALLLEENSRNTRDNARYTIAIAEQKSIHSVLLVTSSLHMPRAIAEFRAEGIDATAMSVPERARRDSWRQRWMPSPSALWRSGRALKEYGALMLLQFDGLDALRRASYSSPVSAHSR